MILCFIFAESFGRDLLFLEEVFDFSIANYTLNYISLMFGVECTLVMRINLCLKKEKTAKGHTLHFACQ